MHKIIGVVDVEHDHGWRLAIATAIEINEGLADPIECALVGQVLETRDGRLARQAGAAFRCAVQGDLQAWIVAQFVEIVAVFIAGRNRHAARRDHIAVAVRDARRVACVDERACDHVSQPEQVRHLAQHNDACVRRQVAAVTRGCERLRLRRRQVGKKWCSVHGDEWPEVIDSTPEPYAKPMAWSPLINSFSEDHE